jgi:hypothetical protein
MHWLALLALGGCYMEAGLGGTRGGATGHGSIGLIAHFGASGSVRAGAGGGIGPFRPSTGETGALTVNPVAFGGEVRIVGGKRDSLVAAVDAEIPALGHLHVPDFDHSEPATTFRGFIGPGYHHDWWQMPKQGAERTERIAAGVTTSLGAELWYGDSKSALRDSSLSVGLAFSVMLEMRAWLLGELFECLSAKHGCDE